MMLISRKNPGRWLWPAPRFRRRCILKEIDGGRSLMLSIAHFLRLAYLAVLLTLAGFLLQTIPAQTPSQPGNAATTATASRPFNIGFLTEGSDFPRPQQLMEELSGALQKNPNFVSALRSANYSGITLSPCPDPREMEQRLGIGEFDLALTTAIIYARRGDAYTPLLQTRLPGDFTPPGRQTGVLRRGVIFAGAGSKLFQTLRAKHAAGPERDALIKKALTQGPIAFTWAQNAAGYIFPRLKLAHDFGIGTQIPFAQSPLFCGSDAEVVKTVVSGIAPLGACRKGEIATLLPDPTLRSQCVEELLETDLFPTDPILVRQEFAPAHSTIGSELKPALRQFFNVAIKNSGGLLLADASADDYVALSRILQQGTSVLKELELPTPELAASLKPKPVAALQNTSATSTVVPATHPLRPELLKPALPSFTNTPKRREKKS